MPVLLSLERDPQGSKEYKAVFRTDAGRRRTVRFGQRTHGEELTFVQHGDEERRRRYWQRHRHDRLDDPMTPGALSAHILWGPTRDIDFNIAVYRDMFGV